MHSLDSQQFSPEITKNNNISVEKILEKIDKERTKVELKVPEEMKPKLKELKKIVQHESTLEAKAMANILSDTLASIIPNAFFEELKGKTYLRISGDQENDYSLPLGETSEQIFNKVTKIYYAMGKSGDIFQGSLETFEGTDTKMEHGWLSKEVIRNNVGKKFAKGINSGKELPTAKVNSDAVIRRLRNSKGKHF